jgi:CTP-dependent riboflavin kinase
MFLNDNFRVLEHLYEQRDGNKLIKTTQAEVAEQLHLSRVTVNKAFRLFMQKECIKKDVSKVGRYYITEVGCNIVQSIRNTHGGRA